MRVDTLIVRMSKIRTLRKRRALSPVIATVIIVAVTITVAVAVSYWLSGIAGQYTSFEKIEIQSAYAVKFDNIPESQGAEGDSKGWRITLQLQNTGTGEATLMDCFVNNMPLTYYGTDIVWSYDTTVTPTEPLEELMTSAGLTLLSGVKQVIYVDIKQFSADTGPAMYATSVTFTSGTTINVKIHSAAGMDYIRLVQLP